MPDRYLVRQCAERTTHCWNFHWVCFIATLMLNGEISIFANQESQQSMGVLKDMRL